MEKLVLFNASFFFLLLLLLKGVEVEAAVVLEVEGTTKLLKFNMDVKPVHKMFVFGDSYADSGNSKRGSTDAWKPPYGSTFQQPPNGRWSDSRVMSDVFAIQLGIKTPVAYQWRKNNPRRKRAGMNFAYGGTGVFDTDALFPNMTQQIGFFQDMIKQGHYSSDHLNDSIALVSLAGNDYATFFRKNSSQDITAFSVKVVKQLSLNLERLQKLGLKKIVVASMPPIGCLPNATVNISFTNCVEPYNQIAQFHNSLLEQTVKNLNGIGRKNIAVLDLYSSFMNILENKQGSSKNPLKPCCEGKAVAMECGDVDEEGNKQYTVCEKPESAFFWDYSHPSHAGWLLVSPYIKSTIEEIY